MDLSKQNIFDERFHRHWKLGGFTDDDNDLPNEFRLRHDTLDRTALRMQRKDAVRDEADAEAERDKIRDQVEAIRLHGGFDLDVVAGKPRAEKLAGDRLFAHEEEALFGKQARQFGGRNLRRKGRQTDVRRSDGNELVAEAMANFDRAGKLRRRGDDTHVEFAAFDRAQDERTGLLAKAKLHARKLFLKTAEEPRQIREPNRPCDPDPENFGRQVESFAERADRFGHAGEDSTRAGVQGGTGRSETNRTSRSIKQRETEPLFHAANLPGDGALGETRGLTRFGKALMLRDQMEQLQFVKIERAGREKLIHPGNDCNESYEFPAMQAVREALSVMADMNSKNEGNVPGRFYVDTSCIDCDLCRENAPETFRFNQEIGMTIVYRQPETQEEIALAAEAMDACPVEAIGNDGNP
jgi:ferredoxin